MDTKTEKNYQLLTEFAKEKDLPVKTLRKIIYLLDERGMPFDKEENSLVVTPFQEQLLLETLELFEAEGRKSYPKAVESCLANHGLGQEQGQAWQRQAQTVARSSFGPWLCVSTPDF